MEKGVLITNMEISNFHLTYEYFLNVISRIKLPHNIVIFLKFCRFFHISVYFETNISLKVTQINHF